jgi:CrcB protein
VKEFVAVAVGGAVGAVSRYSVYLLAAHYIGRHFPYATLIVNILGSLIMGMFIEMMALVWNVGMEVRLFVVVGILGAFTTFSTFSLDVAVLYERGELWFVAVYVLASVVLSIGALFLGLYVVRTLVSTA